MNKFIVALLVFVAINVSARHNYMGKFPTSPDPELTPGSLCTHPDEYYYRERVPHCRRNVSPGLKNDIIRMYDRQRDFDIERMNRRDFKIDHYIPLCAGGSNRPDNLWPQHESVYEITDPMEQLICEKMSEGRLHQREALILIREGKNDLRKVPEIIAEVNAL